MAGYLKWVTLALLMGALLAGALLFGETPPGMAAGVLVGGAVAPKSLRVLRQEDRSHDDHREIYVAFEIDRAELRTLLRRGRYQGAERQDWWRRLEAPAWWRPDGAGRPVYYEWPNRRRSQSAHEDEVRAIWLAPDGSPEMPPAGAAEKSAGGKSAAGEDAAGESAAGEGAAGESAAGESAAGGEKARDGDVPPGAKADASEEPRATPRDGSADRVHGHFLWITF